MTDDKIVEAMAIAIYNLIPSVRINDGSLVPWEDMVAATDIGASVKVARCRKHAQAALSVARPMIEAQRWLPIESAPKDGSEFLAYDREAKKFDVCEMIKFVGTPWTCRPVQYDSVYGPFETDFGYDWENVTHWMPLPTPPATGENENG